MSKRKPAMVSKHTRRQKTPAKAQRAKETIVKSPKVGLRSVATEPPLSSLRSPSDSKNEVVETVENLAIAFQDDLKQTMQKTGSKRGLDFSSASANVQAYQGKVLEMAQANMQFALEFAQRLASIRSPVELLRVIEELTSKRIALFQKHSKEMLELSTNQ